MNKLPTKARYKIAEAAEKWLLDTKSERTSGYCERAKKQMLRLAGVPEVMRTESAGSARDAFEQYNALGLVMPKGTRPQIGDILYKVGDGDGKFGHVGIKSKVNRVIENSSAHVGPGDTDARGWRSEANFKTARIVRLWETPKK